LGYLKKAKCKNFYCQNNNY